MATVLITWDDVEAVAKAVGADLATIPAPEQGDIMEQSAVYADVSILTFCGGFIRFAGETAHLVFVKAMQANRAAHLAANRFVLAAGEGADTTESIGGVSSSRNQPVNNPQADQGFLETIYGRTFQDYLVKYQKLLDEVAKRFSVSFGLYSGGSLKGFPVVVPPSC
jgi:hypothetical protein